MKRRIGRQNSLSAAGPAAPRAVRADRKGHGEKRYAKTVKRSWPGEGGFGEFSRAGSQAVEKRNIPGDYTFQVGNRAMCSRKYYKWTEGLGNGPERGGGRANNELSKTELKIQCVVNAVQLFERSETEEKWTSSTG